MTLPLENLDNKIFDDLVKEAIARIPIYAPEWTDHNRSDPGITFIELFAWLSEMQIYRLNKINRESYVNFLKLFGINQVDENQGSNLPDSSNKWSCSICNRHRNGMQSLKPQDDVIAVSLEEAIAHAGKDLRRISRAVTAEDFEYLALQTLNKDNKPIISRAKAIPNYHPALKDTVPNTVSVVVVPELTTEQISGLGGRNLGMDQETINAVYKNLDNNRPLTIEIFILPPVFIDVTVIANIVIKKGHLDRFVKNKVKEALNRFLDPFVGGSNGKGWPFGRDVYISEIYEIVNHVDGIDFVLGRDNDPGLILRSKAGENGEDGSIKLPEHALVVPGDHVINVVVEV